MAALTNAIQNNLLNNFGSGRKNHIMQSAVRVNLNAISKMGEKCSIAALAITKPMPQIMATLMAERVSRGFMQCF